jgi:hypothetical protein
MKHQIPGFKMNHLKKRVLLVAVLVLLLVLQVALLGEAAADRTEYKLWKSEHFEAWKGEKYFEEVSKTMWYETLNKKILREYKFVSRNERNEVILARSDGSFYIKLTPDMAKWGKSEARIARIYERGGWACKKAFWLISRI